MIIFVLAIGIILGVIIAMSAVVAAVVFADRRYRHSRHF